MPLAPRHRVRLPLPGPWPACAQGLLRKGARWLHAGGPGGWGLDLVAFPGRRNLESRWDGAAFRSPGGRTPWEALQEATDASHCPWFGAATFELACAEAGLPFQPPPSGSLGMSWQETPVVLAVTDTGAELWGWDEAPPSAEDLGPGWGGACALGRPHLAPLACTWDEGRHAEAVTDIQRRIRDGEFYVANLCVPFEARLSGDALTLALARLRGARPPFGAWMPLGDAFLLSFSMERLLSLKDGRLRTEPIKGSVPLTGDPLRDAEAGRTLAADPKERAEHTMIVDLLRNDLGRIAKTGSVEVRDPLALRPYPTVQHLVSTVEADLREGVALADLLRAVLPGGSVTGAPKHAVCTHLARTEAGPRGFYCGALGWIGPGGDCLDLALPIRTAQLRGESLVYWTGGGITRRSDPRREWAELHLKTRVLESLSRNPRAPRR